MLAALVEVVVGTYALVHDAAAQDSCREKWLFCVVATAYFAMAALFGFVDMLVCARPFKALWVIGLSGGYVSVVIIGCVSYFAGDTCNETSVGPRPTLNTVALAHFLTFFMLGVLPGLVVRTCCWLATHRNNVIEATRPLVFVRVLNWFDGRVFFVGTTTV